MAGYYVPARGDLIWLQFHPQKGYEQRGSRPGIVISPKRYNSKTGLALVCPITKQVKGYPFEVPLSKGGKVEGVVLSDQIKSLDWKARKAKFISRAPLGVITEIVEKAVLLVSG